VINTVAEKKRNLKTDSTATVFPEGVEQILKSCPNGLAPGVDSLHTNLKTVVDIVSPVLASLYTEMLRNAYIPGTLKQGIIITLHKCGRKRKDEPSSYRVITLTSVILKIYENILFNRCKHDMLEDLNLQQGGFQDILGCIMTSSLCVKVYSAQKKATQPSMCVFMTANKPSTVCGIVVFHTNFIKRSMIPPCQPSLKCTPI